MNTTNCSNPESKKFQHQLRAWRIVLHRKQRFFDKRKISSKIQKYVDDLSMKYSHLSAQEFLQTRPVQSCLSEKSHQNQYSCRDYCAPFAQPLGALREHANSSNRQAFSSLRTHQMLLEVEMSHFEKKSRKCVCPKCPVLKSSYCNIDYTADGNAKTVDGVCPCCRKADNHGQSIDDEDTEDEGAEEECPNVQPYLQLLYDVERSIEDSKSEAEETALMLPLRRIPCAGKNCPARYNSLCSVKNIRLPLGGVEFKCPCDNVCFISDCVDCNSKVAQQLPIRLYVHKCKGKSEKQSHVVVRINVVDSSKERYSAYAVQQQDSGNVSDGSSCNSPVLVRQKPKNISVPRIVADVIDISSDEDNIKSVVVICSSDDEMTDI